MTVEIDPTYQCPSSGCGGHCFSAFYRSQAPHASISTHILQTFISNFAVAGGRILRFDGGGDPLCHKDIRSGHILEQAGGLGLKTTILTSGDLLQYANTAKIAQSRCYMRISLNAAKEETRKQFHGNNISLSSMVKSIANLSRYIAVHAIDIPIGATFLLSHVNFSEVLECAKICKNSGVNHFSIRRILGPVNLRPQFSEKIEKRLNDLLTQVKELHNEEFRVFVPWRSVYEPDFNPSIENFTARQCWQSTFKSVLEPDPDTSGARMQLCGRYRGNGLGQKMVMPALFNVNASADWIEKWRDSFDTYEKTRKELLTHFMSCIDRGFITLLDCLLHFLSDSTLDFQIHHLNSEKSNEFLIC